MDDSEISAHLDSNVLISMRITDRYGLDENLLDLGNMDDVERGYYLGVCHLFDDIITVIIEILIM